MTPRRFSLATALVLLVLPTPASSQAASEQATLTQIISGTEVEIRFSRPSLRGREEIFGRQIPWGEVWTPGANAATTIRFSNDVVVSGEPVAAGRYSVWLQVRESEPWRLALHPDTTLFHSAHPPIDEAAVQFVVERARGEELQESLTWDLDRIRIDGAELTMRWGWDRVAVSLEVDPGIVLATPPADALPLVGEWSYDDTPSMPSPEQMARLAGQPENPTARYFEVLASESRPRPIGIAYDDDTGLLWFVDDLTEAAEAAFYSGEGEQPVVVYGQALLPRGDGFFTVAGTLGGEVTAVNPRFSPMIEFDFDGEGRAVSFTIRGPDERVHGTGVRVGG